MLIDKNNNLYYLQIILRLVKTHKELRSLYNSFIKYFTNDRLNQINKYFKADFITFCEELVKKYELFQRLNNKNIFFEEINTVNSKLNLMKSINNTLNYDNGRDIELRGADHLFK